jgi:putative ABC transport system permease protein
MLRNKPGFTIMAVLALALGIGANTAIFSVVSAVLLQPLPYRDPGRLVMVWQKLTTAAQSGPLACSAPDYVDYRDQSKTLENVAGYLKQSFNMITAEGALRIDGMRVSANAFPLLGIAAYRGRVFTAAEDRDGGEPVALLSYGAWQRRFAADPQILGRTLVLDQKPYKVIGVMARDFSFPPEGLGEGTAPEIWVPMAFTPALARMRAATTSTSPPSRASSRASPFKKPPPMSTASRPAFTPCIRPSCKRFFS